VWEFQAKKEGATGKDIGLNGSAQRLKQKFRASKPQKNTESCSNIEKLQAEAYETQANQLIRYQAYRPCHLR